MKLFKKSSVKLGFAVVATSALLLMSGVSANAAELAPDPLAAITNATPQSVADAAQVPTTDTGTNAIDAVFDGIEVIVPTDPAAGIQIKSREADVSVGLPFASTASEASAKGAGIVAYDNKNGSSTVPIVQKNGDVQLNTVIRNSTAPKRYSYPVSVPEGQTIKLAPDGSAYVAGDTGVPSLYFAAPTAKDANGDSVPTTYEVDGNTLTQVVGFTAQTEFPVVGAPLAISASYYSYNCVLQNGSSYFMTPGSLLSSCKGSYIQKYINGVNVQTIPLTGYGTLANPDLLSLDCLVALLGLSVSGAGVAKAIVQTINGVIAWVGVGLSVYSLKACRA